MTLKELFTDALDRALRAPVKRAKRMDRPPIAGMVEGKIPSLSNKELAEILGDEELSKAK
jgi:hypothetical protein